MLSAKFRDNDWQRIEGPKRCQMIVLHQDGIMQSHPVIGAAAGLDSTLFEKSPAWRCLPGIEEQGLRSTRFLGVASRESCNAAEASQKIKGSSFTRENRSG